MRSILAIAAWFTLATASSDLSTPLLHVRSGTAAVHYLHPPSVVLDMRSPSGRLDRIPLTYEQSAQEHRAAIWNAQLVYESRRHFIIFTDAFESNSDIQAQCGASGPDGDYGERFLHVVSLVPPMRETVSVIIDSCWLDIIANKTTPTYDAQSRTLTVQLVKNSDKEVTIKYHLDENGQLLSQ